VKSGAYFHKQTLGDVARFSRGLDCRRRLPMVSERVLLGLPDDIFLPSDEASHSGGESDDFDHEIEEFKRSVTVC